MDEPTLGGSSVDVRRSQLKGVTAETGALVSFRDTAAFEMVMRLNQRHNGKLVLAIMTANNKFDEGNDDGVVYNGQIKTNTKRKEGVEEEMFGVAGGVCDSKHNLLVFVPEAYEAFLEGEMQKWLDPFHSCEETVAKKRFRGELRDFSADDKSSADESDYFNDYCSASSVSD